MLNSNNPTADFQAQVQAQAQVQTIELQITNIEIQREQLEHRAGAYHNLRIALDGLHATINNTAKDTTILVRSMGSVVKAASEVIDEFIYAADMEIDNSHAVEAHLRQLLNQLKQTSHK